MKTHCWTGDSGTEYEYGLMHIAPVSDRTQTPHPLARPGNFIYASGDDLSGWRALHIGEAENIVVAIEKLGGTVLECANRLSMSAVHVRFESDKTRRQAEQRDLIKRHNPPCQ